MALLPAVQTEHLAVGYGKTPKAKEVLTDINLAAAPGQLIALIGANGTGKSTLLRTLAGIQPLLAGEIWLNGRRSSELTPLESASILSIVLTDRIQTGYFTVGDLVAMGRHPYTDWRGRMNVQDLEATRDALSITGLLQLKETDLHELSDGQLQKAMIARALAQDGDLMLLDEPLVHLDIPSKWEIMSLLKRMAHDQGKTVILASHELELSLQMADRIWLVSKNGQLISGTPKDMIMKGTISETFNTDHYQFDLKRFI